MKGKDYGKTRCTTSLRSFNNSSSKTMIIAFTEADIDTLATDFETHYLIAKEFNPFLHVHIYAVAHTTYTKVRFFSIRRPLPSERQYLYVKVEGLPTTPQLCVTQSLADRYKIACNKAMEYAENLYEMLSPRVGDSNDKGREPSYNAGKLEKRICSELRPLRKRLRCT